MYKTIVIFILAFGLGGPGRAQILPGPGAQCSIGSISKQFDFCGYGYIRFSTTAISGATYTWNVLGTTVGGTTTNNYIDVQSNELTNGTYTMGVRATCQINNCTVTSTWRYLTFTVTCGGSLIKRRPVLEMPPVADAFDGLDLARMLAENQLFRAHHELTDDVLTLINLSGERGRFHVVAIHQDRFMTTHILELDGGESHDLLMNAGAVEVYVLSPLAFTVYNYDQEWLGERPDRNLPMMER